MTSSPSGYNTSRFESPNIEVRTVKEEFFEIGKIKVKTVYGKNIAVYKEITICDILRLKNKVDKPVLNQAVNRYVNSKEKDIYKLTQLAKIFRVGKALDSYLEVLL